MDNKLQVRTIYIDSRFNSGGTSSNFTYNLPESICLPDNVICYVDNIVIGNSWKTIDSSNNKRYVKRVATGGTGAPIQTYKIIELNENNYNPTTLKTELETKLNATTNFGTGFCTVSYDQVLLRMDINLSASNQTIRIFTDDELQNSDEFALPYDKSELQNANEVFGIFEPQSAQVYKTGIINLMRYRNLYLTCPSLSNYSTLAPSGNSNVVKKIPVTAGYGDIIYCNLLSIHDYIDVSKLMIKTLEFQICDSYGKVINLRNIPVSFSLIFMPNAE